MKSVLPNHRFLSVWLERLSTDRIERKLSPAPSEQAPRVIVRDIKSALRLVALNEAASKLGLSVGLALADARAMYPDIVIEHADDHADQSLLGAIADWTNRYTPLVGLDAPDGM